MNLGRRQKLMEQIHRLERLLDYAEQIRDEAEIVRIRAELMSLVEECGDGSCVKCGG